jgi:2-(1,2-epoxy-1,2-dihydrophenyl)acetyl-CoA isomerase
MQYETIILEVKDRIATVTLNRPEKLNAENNKMADELVDVFNALDRLEEAGVVVITGSGRAFCAGADLKERFLPRIEEKKKGIIRDVTQEFSELGCLALARIRKPTIAAVNGPASGVGCTLAVSCDIRIASTEAKFGFPFVRVGISPEFGSTYYLPRLIGIGKACELVFTGQTLDAQEAKEIGLVNQVVAPDRLKEATYGMAEKILKMPPLAIQISKRALYQGMRAPDLASHLQYETLAFVHLLGTQDHEEGVKAFLEKREPVFKGQ